MSLLPVWVGPNDDSEDVDIALFDEVELACDGDVNLLSPLNRRCVVVMESAERCAPADRVTPSAEETTP